MDSGKLQLNWEQTSEAIALINLGNEGEESFSLLRRLVADASASHPQLSKLRFVNIPRSNPRLENWSHWLAAQVVEQWRDLPVEDHSMVAIVNELGLSSAEGRVSLLDALSKATTGTPLTLQLTMRFQLLRERQRKQRLAPAQQKQWLDQEVAGLAQWFSQPSPAPSEPSQLSTEESGCLAQLQSNILVLRSKVRHQLQDCFVQLQRAGSRTLRQRLEVLSEALDAIRADYEAQRQDYLRRESSAWRAYYTLIAPLEERWGLFGRGRLDWEAVLRALTMAYDFKLGAEMSTQAAQLVGELAQQTRLYAASVLQVDAFLASLQNWFTERGSVEPLFVSLLQDSLAAQANPAQLRSELENWVSCTFDQWDALELTQTAALREQILARTLPLCLDVYVECCRCLLNLDPPDRQTQLTKMAQSPASAPLSTMPPHLEKRLSLQVRNADIRDALALLGQVSGEKVVADDSLSSTVTLALNDVSVTEALNALMVAGNLTYTKSGDVYTFSQLPSADSPVTAIPKADAANPADREISRNTEN